MFDGRKLYIWKSKEAQKREDKKYEKWAFPYGLRQRDGITALLRSVFPHENESIALIAFLTCRELYEDALESCEDRDDAIKIMLNEVKRYKSIISRENMPIYMALVLSNEDIDERLKYPDAKKIAQRAEELMQL